MGDHKSLNVPVVADRTKGDGNNGDKGVHPSDDLEESHDERLRGGEVLHEEGARCWNGPARNARVVLFCAGKNVIRDLKETEKCVYRFEVGTPAVCEEWEGGEGEEGVVKKVEEGVRSEL